MPPLEEFALSAPPLSHAFTQEEDAADLRGSASTGAAQAAKVDPQAAYIRTLVEKKRRLSQRPNPAEERETAPGAAADAQLETHDDSDTTARQAEIGNAVQQLEASGFPRVLVR